MTYEESILLRYSTPALRRNCLTRSAKKLNMEFDDRFNKWTKAERDAFLDKFFPPETSHDEPHHDAKPDAGEREAPGEPGSHHAGAPRQDQEGGAAEGSEDGAAEHAATGRTKISDQVSDQSDAGTGQPEPPGSADGGA
jgi:hypothetical protein